MLDDTTPIIGAMALGPRRETRAVAIYRNTAAAGVTPRVERRAVPVSIDTSGDPTTYHDRWVDVVTALIVAHRHDPYFHFEVPAAGIADILNAGKDAL